MLMRAAETAAAVTNTSVVAEVAVVVATVVWSKPSRPRLKQLDGFLHACSPLACTVCSFNSQH
jgi:hypothetical protein